MYSNFCLKCNSFLYLYVYMYVHTCMYLDIRTSTCKTLHSLPLLISSLSPSLLPFSPPSFPSLLSPSLLPFSPPSFPSLLPPFLPSLLPPSLSPPSGVFIVLKALSGPLAKVKEENPLLFRKFTAECYKLGFSEIIRPCEWIV